jgi:lysophospholipase L1-like esterase
MFLLRALRSCLPVLLIQGLWVRLRTPRLPDAAGPCSGTAPGDGIPLDLIVLGESTVAGVGASTHERGLTGQTASALARRTGRSIRWRAIGLSGATARDAHRELVPQLAGSRADALIIVLGVNDVAGWHGVSRWTRDVEQLLAGVRGQLASSVIILPGVPPFQYIPAFPQPLRSALGVRARLLDRAYSDLARTHSRVIHVSSQFKLDREFFCQDGFHPSESGYAAWGEQLAEAIIPFL